MNIFKELMDKSWATPGVGRIENIDRSPGASAKTGLMFLLAVLTSMFSLFIVGYRLRMGLADWQPLADPTILWLNTALLVLASITMQLAKNAAGRGEIRSVRLHLTLAGIFTIAFLVGQYTAWQALVASGMYTPANPAFAFFVLLTTLHALHLIGGLYVWAKSALNAWTGMEIIRFKVRVELCTTYWHYLLFVWVVFFAILLTT
jgi:cytochrome c oxidase subunit 3